MHRNRMILRALTLTLVLFPSTLFADASLKEQEATLKAASLETTDEALLKFFSKRALDIDPEKIRQMVANLGSRSYIDRVSANEQLQKLGINSVPALLQAQDSPDREIRHRAQVTLVNIRRQDKVELIQAAATVLAHRNPKGTARALVRSLPTISDPVTVQMIHDALAKIARPEGKVEPDLVTALSSQHPATRAGAAVALCRVNATEHFATIEKLLDSEDTYEQMHVGIALARQGNKNAIPVLIRLLTKVPASQIWEIEDILYSLALDTAPDAPFGIRKDEHKKFSEAWMTWWHAHSKKLDLKARLQKSDKPLGYTTVVLLDEGKVVDLDENKKERFAVADVSFPLDVEMLPGERLLLAEHGANEVRIRHRSGKILWKYGIAEPLVAQRLPNGDIFIAGKNRLTIVDRAGQEKFSYTRPNPSETFMRARWLPNGDVLCVTLYQNFMRINSEGQVVLTFGVNVSTSGGRIDLLPNGNVLVPEMNYNRVGEYSLKARRLVKSYPVSEPIVAMALPNGNVLATSMDEKAAIELSTKGGEVKEVWKFSRETRVTRAVRR